MDSPAGGTGTAGSPVTGGTVSTGVLEGAERSKSTRFLRAAATSLGRASKNVSFVTASMSWTLVRYSRQSFLLTVLMLGIRTAMTRVEAVIRLRGLPGPGGTTTTIFQPKSGTATF